MIRKVVLVGCAVLCLTGVLCQSSTDEEVVSSEEPLVVRVEENTDYLEVGKRQSDFHGKALGDPEMDKRELEWTNNTFQQFDIDQDQLLSPDEVRTYLRSRLNMDSDVIPEMIKPFDADENGQLSVEEFQKFEQDLPYEKTVPLPLMKSPGAM
uniref:EF-hand domain-containing protein n=1 Tax=Steinernema glaseri TaxID=37863 RepID=A0A1I7Y6R7_9BILA